MVANVIMVVSPVEEAIKAGLLTCGVLKTLDSLDSVFLRGIRIAGLLLEAF